MNIIAIIPALNEEKTIDKVVELCLEYVDKVIVVDDGSTDNTAEKAAKAGAVVIVHDRNQGKAKAVESGVLHAKADIYILLDGDLQHDPKEIPALINGLKDADICIGSRFLGNTSSMPLLRKFSNKVMTYITDIFTGYHLTDVQSGFRAIRGVYAKKLVSGLERYSIEIGMIFYASDLGLKITEVPIKTIYGAEKSKISVLRDGLILIKFFIKYFISGDSRRS